MRSKSSLNVSMNRKTLSLVGSLSIFPSYKIRGKEIYVQTWAKSYALTQKLMHMSAYANIINTHNIVQYMYTHTVYCNYTVNVQYTYY